MYEYIKSEMLVDWNANETIIDSPEINTPFAESVETEMNSVETEMNSVETEMKSVETKMNSVVTEMNSVEECTNGTKTKKKMNKPYIKQQRLPTRLKVCVTVPVNHFGPIPGIPVGTCWEKRIQVSEAGVHRPPVAGIHGREYEGAYSIVFSGTYPDDEDWGEEFFYSGCGGVISHPKKIISGQTCDQTLTHHNKALAVSCHAPVNDQTGAVADDWRAGKPIRVVRTYKLKKRSNFAPDEGNRYDGIYKVVRYFPTMGQCGLLVWRFHLRRDDPEPAPWTEEGKLAIAEKNIQMIRAETMDYIEKVSKHVNSKNGKRLSQKLPPKKIEYPFPDEETFDKIIRESLLATSDAEDEETKPALDWLSFELESQKSSAQQSPKKKWKNKFTKSHENSALNGKVPSKSKKSRAQSKLEKSGTWQSPKKKLKTKSKRSLNANSSASQNVKSTTKSRVQSSKQLSYNWTSLQFLDEATSEKIIGLEMGSPTANADNLKENLQAANGLLESPRKRSRKQNLNEVFITDSYEYVGYRTFGTENDQKVLANHLTFPSSEMEKTDEYYNQSDMMEIVPDISFFQVNKSPEPAAKRNCNPKSNRSRKNVATNSKTNVNRKRNASRSSITDFVEPIEIECQIDLTTEEEDEPYVLPANVEKFINIDMLNKNIWEYCKKNFLKSETDFKDVVSVMFTCRYCNQLAVNPVTTPCDHNACLECISNHFSKEIFSCPDCRNDLGRSFKIKENRNLAGALENLFPGYNLRY